MYVCEYGDCQEIAIDQAPERRGARLCQKHDEEFAQIVREWGPDGPRKAVQFWLNLKRTKKWRAELKEHGLEFGFSTLEEEEEV